MTNSEWFDWDDEITDEGSEYKVVLPGKYQAKVEKVETIRWEGNGKLSGCPTAEISLKVFTDDGVAYVKDNLFLTRSMEWKIGAFLKSAGLKKKGEPIVAKNVKKAVGKELTVTITCNQGKENNYKNMTADEVKEALEAGEAVYNGVNGYAEPTSVHDNDDSDFGFED